MLTGVILARSVSPRSGQRSLTIAPCCCCCSIALDWPQHAPCCAAAPPRIARRPRLFYPPSRVSLLSLVLFLVLQGKTSRALVAALTIPAIRAIRLVVEPCSQPRARALLPAEESASTYPRACGYCIFRAGKNTRAANWSRNNADRSTAALFRFH